MPQTRHLPLSPSSLGTTRTLTVHRFGTAGARPKVYLQAGLHADELPGLVVLQALLARLQVAEQAGKITGEIVVVPVANPIGLDQHFQGQLLGRFETATGHNFNRRHLDPVKALLHRALPLMDEDPAENVAAARSVLREEWLAAGGEDPHGRSEGDHLRHVLYGLAFDADLVLDLHCDWDAVMHTYTSTASWPQTAGVMRLLGAEAVLIAEESGGNPFDEALSLPWVRLASAAGERPVPMGCHSMTVELRGQTDISDSLAAADADALLAVLTHWGALSGPQPELPAARCDATPLEAVDMVTAPAAGIIVYTSAVGSRVKAGDCLGWVVNPLGGDGISGSRVPFHSRTDGLIYGRLLQRLVRPGDTICKVAGDKPLAHRTGPLLTA